MKKIIVACFAALLLIFGGVSSAQADEYLRVGMEAANNLNLFNCRMSDIRQLSSLLHLRQYRPTLISLPFGR